MSDVRALHGCECNTFVGPKMSHRCDLPATLYSSERTGKNYWLCPHHFGVFAKDTDLRASDESTVQS